MLFNSFEFILGFLPIVFLFYFWLNRLQQYHIAKLFLVLASLFFYSYWNINYLPLILSSVLVNFFLAKQLVNFDAAKRLISKKALLFVGIGFNLGLLGYFKYLDFFIININYLTGWEIALFQYALPLAISFFTLQQIALLIDAYEGLLKEHHFVNYTLFVTFFPQLIAGPIVHHKEMMPQFESVEAKRIQAENLKLGFYIFSIGLFKKIILADTLAVWVDDGLAQADTLSVLDAWLVSVSYTFQLYFDFSGYTDMAIGIAMMFNIRLPHNFNSPFIALNIIDFWKRWHMTLTNFIASYIYTPLLRSFKTITMTHAMIATFITMQIAGIWHGAEWKYIVFGTLHSVALVVNHLWKAKKYKMNQNLSWLLTFVFICITFTIFRGDTLSQSMTVIQHMFDWRWLNFEQIHWLNIGYVSIMLMTVFLLPNTLSLLNAKRYHLPAGFVLLGLSFMQLNYFMISDDQASKFIYFNF